MASQSKDAIAASSQQQLGSSSRTGLDTGNLVKVTIIAFSGTTLAAVLVARTAIVSEILAALMQAVSQQGSLPHWLEWTKYSLIVGTDVLSSVDRLCDKINADENDVIINACSAALPVRDLSCSPLAPSRINNRRIEWCCDCVAHFAVIILGVEQDGQTGLELGVRTQDGHTYVSSGGFLWIDGKRKHGWGMWRTTHPRWLVKGDKVHFAVLCTGAIVIYLNNELQAHWDIRSDRELPAIPPGQPLETVIRMSRPCRSVQLLLPEVQDAFGRVEDEM
mmetsp:Transcript_60414/g.144032  ORF Transcript_60414/g.144032 Transcript_60414/m.144032 type:complete len:277 (+) Transcript_60414:69-899(+)